MRLTYARTLLIIALISIVYGLIAFLYYYNTPYYNGYISDEIWYVDSARNLLYLIGAEPKLTKPYTATIFIKPEADTQEVVSLINSSYPDVKILQTLSKIKAIYVETNNLTQLEDLGKLPEIKYLRPGYVYGDAGEIDTYYNLEHPPLAKYFIMYSMMIFGDKPFYWRLPSILLGVLKVFVIGVFIYRITKEPIFGILASLTILMDPVNVYMDGLAMLEPYVAFFTILSAIFICLRKDLLAGLFIGLSGASKMSGFFVALPGLFISIATRKSLVKSLFYYVVTPLIIYILLNIPIMLLFGASDWWSRSVIGALSWHLSTKTRPGEGPPISAPWEWFVGINPFYVTINPDTPIRGNIIIYLGTIVLSVASLLFFIRYRELVREYVSIIQLLIISYGTWLGYVIVWFAGNHSEYSFYMAQVAPLFDTLFISLLYLFYKEYDRFAKMISEIISPQRSQ
ncbi:MAG: glycosyltransferase family 39 protein [Sulfolobales archaeon]